MNKLIIKCSSNRSKIPRMQKKSIYTFIFCHKLFQLQAIIIYSILIYSYIQTSQSLDDSIHSYCILFIYFQQNRSDLFVLMPFTSYSLSFTFTIYLSISPNTTSSVPMIATISASMWFFPMWSITAKWANPGALILHLQRE